MAYPMYAQPPAPTTRPTTVRVSSYLLYVTAAVSVITAVLSLSQISTINGVYKDVYAGTAAQGTEAVAGISSAIGAVFYLVFAVGMVILAHFNNKGRQGSRITTWVIAGISACCTAGGAIANGFTNSILSSLGTTSAAGQPSPAELQRKLNEALPSWYTPVTVTLAVVSALAAVGAIILLALPASNAYFRKTAPGFDPSMPYPQYGAQPPNPGGQPPYPPYPGQPTGQPPYPPYPGQSGQPPYLGQAGQPPYPGQSGQPPRPVDGPSGQEPHTGSIPPTDPWGRPRDNGPDRPPTDPPART